MNQKILEGILLDESIELSLRELCRACSSSEEWLIELVEEGALEPIEDLSVPIQPTQWHFTVNSIQTARTAMRLQRDLDINLSGVALALDLLNEIETLKSQLKYFEMKGVR